MDSATTYVSKKGYDENCGKSWSDAKLTIAAAIDALPLETHGGDNHHKGRINVGSGRFDEVGPLEVNAGLHYIGMGTDPFSGTGTVIQLADNSNSHLFAPTADWNSFAHHVLFRDLVLDGNKVNNLGDHDLIHIQRGGFNCRLDNVFFRQAPRYGVYAESGAVNLQIFGCTWAHCEVGAIMAQAESWLVLDVLHGQIDNCGKYPISIDHENTGEANQVWIRNLKLETDVEGQHDACVFFSPRSNPYGHPVKIVIDGITAAQNASGGKSVILEEDRPGHPAQWELRNIHGQGYETAFKSEKTDQASLTNAIHQGSFGELASYLSQTPDFEIKGMGVFASKGSPENVIAAPPGSIALDGEGGPNATFYVKEGGTGKAGWIAK